MTTLDVLFLLSVGYVGRWTHEAIASGRVGAFVRRLTEDPTADAAALARDVLRRKKANA